MGKTFLLTWNPRQSNADLADDYRKWKRVGYLKTDWSVVSVRKIQSGARFFMLQQGATQRGILGSGFILKFKKLDSGFFERPGGRRQQAKFAPIEYDFMLDPDGDMRLSTEVLQRQIPDVYWTPQASGTEIPEDAARVLERLWLRITKQDPAAITAASSTLTAVEGIAAESLRLLRSRNATIREEKILRHRRANDGRLPCEIPGCGFDFAAKYGLAGQNYAQVHHLKPIAEGERVTRLRDLIVVCANCHVMLHRLPKARWKHLRRRSVIDKRSR
jgi:5-methylcytosine-specific restriction protein A